ncbi:tetratricopeptide repeat protein [Anaeromyxobacter sp. PSR-1]|uniref:tetratricopeptide repeat protein n=1 Tax=Anaeromyxobacter sp. PSR-1 TaxID=1300915 RepID=UPI0005E35261|nr:tetratricopeptide repeat protein [Anaeromyxobacter sp. PSR-1]GAO02300.1 transmembrane and TPR repeat-containing protein 3 [Anaeromyxobacter sp. PSR-1]
MTHAGGPTPGARIDGISRSSAHVAALAAVILLGLAAYANAWRGAFVFDDVDHVRDNPILRDASAFGWNGPGWRELPNRSVAYLSFTLNYRLGGSDPTAYHGANIAIHLFTSTLVYALVIAAFRAPRLAPSALAPHASTVALVAAALFVSHPLQTQAVTYIVQRMTSLTALFYVGAVVLYARWRLMDAARHRWGRRAVYAGVLACAVLAMRTKEIAFTLPFAVTLYEITFFEPDGRRLRRLWPILATAAIVPLTVLLAVRGIPGGEDVATTALAATRVQTDLGRLEYFLTQVPVVVTYLFLLLMPVGQNVDHDYPIYRSFLAPEVLSAIAVLAAIGCAGAWAYARTSARARRPADPAARLVGFCVAWWFVALAVESTIIPIVDVINEHRVYLPSVGFFVAAAVGILLAARRAVGVEVAPRAAALAGIGLACVLAAATLARNRVWASDVALWTDAAAKSPNKMRPNLNLGTALVEVRRFREAEAPLRRAAELDATSAIPHVQLAGVLLTQRRGAEAEAELREAIRLDPRDPEAIFNLAVLLSSSNRPADARPLFARFLEIAPDSYARARRIAADRLARP